MADRSTLHHLEQALLEISPDGVASASMPAPDLPPGDPQDVLAWLRGASAQRQREFFGGRQCARAALEQCGIDSGLIGMGADQLPSWPAGFLGSISHSKGYCAAVAANRAQFSGLGLDLEKTNRLSDAAMRRVLHPDELVFAEGDQRQASLLFSAKEAFYKMQFPRWRTTANFHDLALSVDEATSVIKLEVEQISDRFNKALREHAQEIRFRSRFFGDYVVSVCSMDESAVGVARG